jgi:hypothetical protein
MSIPIIDERFVIVGWAETAPELRAGRLYHPEAEQLIGAHYAVYVEIADPADAARAGAPRGWRNVWRCLGLCSEKLMRHRAAQVPPMRVMSLGDLSRPGARPPLPAPAGVINRCEEAKTQT